VNRKINFSGIPAGNPLVNALMVLVGVLAIGAMIVLGIVALLVVSSVLVVLAGIVGLRLWWHGRKLRNASSRDWTDRQRVIEGEYRRVRTRDDAGPDDRE
jgi:protein-S-isoprenylcysteine O-methyltransferase Ste14